MHFFHVATSLLCTLSIWSLSQSTLNAQEAPDSIDDQLVGRIGDQWMMTPVNQLVTPVGKIVELPGLRPQAVALSPDSQILVVSGRTSEIVVLDPATGDIRQRVELPAEDQTEPLPEVVSPNILKPDRKGQVSYTGLTFSPDSRRIYLSNVQGTIKVFAVDDQGQVRPSHTIPLPEANAPRRKQEIPSGLSVNDDGSRLLVCGNLSNTLIEIDTASSQVLRRIPVGFAPYDVVQVHGLAFVSNWGGRVPGNGDLTGPAGRGTEVRVDSVRHIANEGSVSIVDLANSGVTEIITGLHCSGLAVSPDKKHVVAANAASDTISILEVASRSLIDTASVKSKPSDLFGAGPNAVAFDATGEKLYICNGSQNAVAVMDWDPKDKGETRLDGLIPVGWFPGAIAFDAKRQQLCVANIKGLPISPKKTGSTQGFNSHHYHGSLSVVPLPEEKDLAVFSERAAKNMRAQSIADAALPARPDQAPRPIPERIGEPSTIEHVVYIIKENRTYDQIFGALGRGNGDPTLSIFGESITPNQHKIVREFVLLDNTYCSGILSADGHQWSTTALSTDYMEKSFATFPRSYPDGMGIDEADALAYSPAGFLWDNVTLHKKTIRNYGEFMAPKVRWRDPNKPGTPDYLACYRTWRGESQEVLFESFPSIESIRPFSPPAYVGWEMSVPDQYRADYILKELKEFEDRGEYPQMTIICLPNDHTSGTSPKCPTPDSCIADNDLAMGRIIEGLSHSKFWSKMAIFAIEDDPQAGCDHVSGYRTTAYVVSPFAKRGAIVSTQYNTTSIIRTIEQILGLPPMNQFDASATPMFDCFQDTADQTPFVSVPNQVPLDQMNPDPKAIADPLLRQQAITSSTLNFREIDKAPEDVLNRILWHAMKGSQTPYPEWAISLVDEEEEEEEEEARAKRLQKP